MSGKLKSFLTRCSEKISKKCFALTGAVVAAVSSGTVLAAQTGGNNAVDFSVLQTAIDFTSVIAIVLAVGAAAVGGYIAYAGVSMVLRSVRKAGS